MHEDDHDDNPFDAGSLGSLGSLGDDTLGAQTLNAPPISDQLHADFNPSRPLGEIFSDVPEIVEALPVGPATMACVRGPCLHQWRIVQRAPMQSEVVEIQRTQLCCRHVQLQNLVDENILECGSWWPAPLAFVPESARAMLRPLLLRVWDWYLRRCGTDYSWRWWPADAWELDKDQLHKVRLAAIQEHREARRKKWPRSPTTPTAKSR